MTHFHGGFMYTWSDDIQVEIRCARIINPDGADHVQGCVQHDREPDLRVLDFNGDKEYAAAVHTLGYVATDYCGHPKHAGSRFVPVGEFRADASRGSGHDAYCKKCKSDDEHARRVKEAEAQGRKLRQWTRSKGRNSQRTPQPACVSA